LHAGSLLLEHASVKISHSGEAEVNVKSNETETHFVKMDKNGVRKD